MRCRSAYHIVQSNSSTSSIPRGHHESHKTLGVRTAPLYPRCRRLDRRRRSVLGRLRRQSLRRQVRHGVGFQKGQGQRVGVGDDLPGHQGQEQEIALARAGQECQNRRGQAGVRDRLGSIATEEGAAQGRQVRRRNQGQQAHRQLDRWRRQGRIDRDQSQSPGHRQEGWQEEG